VVSGIRREDLARCFVMAAEIVEEGAAAAMKRHGPGARIAVIPKGPFVIPNLAFRPSNISSSERQRMSDTATWP